MAPSIPPFQEDKRRKEGKGVSPSMALYNISPGSLNRATVPLPVCGLFLPHQHGGGGGRGAPAAMFMETSDKSGSKSGMAEFKTKVTTYYVQYRVTGGRIPLLG